MAALTTFGVLLGGASAVLGDAPDDVVDAAVGAEIGPAQGAEFTAAGTGDSRDPNENAEIGRRPRIGEDAGDLVRCWGLWVG